MTGADIVTLGETMALFSDDGPLRHAHNLAISFGGSESNVAIGMSRLGMRVAWLGRVGADPLGERIVRTIRGESIDTRAVVDREAPTGLMLKERCPAGGTRVWYRRAGSAGSRLAATDLDEELIAGTRVLHLTGITPGLSDSARLAVDHAVRLARRAGVVVSIDLNYRRALWAPDEFAAALGPLVAQAHLVFGSPHEVAHLTGASGAEPAELARRLARCGPDIAVVTLAERGAVARAYERDYTRAAFPVDALDPVGAGDAFVAGFLAEYVHDADDVATMIDTACACGAMACTTRGDWEGTPTRDELAQFHELTDAVYR